MRRTFLLLFIFTVALAIGSCKKEYSFEGDLEPGKHCIDCAYLPLCDSSTFRYVDSTAAGVDTLDNIVYILSDTTVHGVRYSSVSGFDQLGQGLLYNCANGDYRLLVAVPDMGINIDSIVNDFIQANPLPIPIPLPTISLPTQFSTRIVKTSLPVNGTWTDTVYSLTIPFLANVFVGIDYTILEKGVTRSVLGKSYGNVIHVQGKVRAAVSATGFPIPPIPLDFATDYYLAKDVGLVEVDIRQDGIPQLSSKLWSYHR
ncbi:MAG: hypothetical protein JWP27_2308 [Flaviaesturariibacter sp.]|nr:hypothetical protein [Flaviaesturariibacter sp.]